MKKIKKSGRKTAKGSEIPPALFILTIYSARYGLHNISPLQFLEMWRSVISKMTGNIHFPNPDIPIATQTAWCNMLEQAIIDAMSGNRFKIARRNELFEEAKDKYRIVANYVTKASGGDREIIRSAGMEERKGRMPSLIPGQVQGLKAVYAGVGKIKLLWNTVSRHPFYHIQFTTDPLHGEWQEVRPGTFRVKYMVESLTPGVLYFFRVYAENSLGHGEVSGVTAFRCG